MCAKREDNSLRYRRAQSVTTAEDITEKENKARRLQYDKPCHRPRDSLFSWSSEFTNFTGLVNWGFLMLTISGLRLCLENFLKYGIRVNPFEWIIVLTGYNDENYKHEYPSIILLCFSGVPPVVCFLIEKAIAAEFFSDKLGETLQIITILLEISLPVIALHFTNQEFNIVGISTACMVYLILFLKLWSYCQTNHWCRAAKSKQSNSLRRQSLSVPNCNALVNDEEDVDDEVVTGIVQYPDNLKLGDLFYFLLAPTLCYELNFPRTNRIRKRFLIKRIVEVIFGMNLVMALFQQWMIPAVTNALDPFSQMDYVRITERLLKLAIPNHLLWLCFFYLTFHSFLNLMGELLHFADRNFYGDWWNARNISVFWSSWNMPVHVWAVRHVYVPVTNMGYSKGVSAIMVFFISAFFHEYLVSVPLQMFRVWAFLGMMAQPPLAVISKVFEWRLGARWGNMVVWSSLILGQPLAIMMYYHDYALTQMKP
ncbi:diacylglycerol O-acyltransferase 1 isoform X1 [Pieris napi]|uniref:diacylglycerol O-acyltransferase 1 isoform X1 n=1 Tax=Pieris napi TaxID=78633 RepID=UPI001FBB7BA1|nr:diacylglycerol O-acyltransferase 1 isoform X1 [Pieris napi]XP_047515415.1 diacylglycerol O-acyltransferase 1 isoform X1 [Pieris napi]XP_047515416.1 diacylglycerol O-acyltransferase 1 isoform X1 [Pieris napi]